MVSEISSLPPHPPCRSFGCDGCDMSIISHRFHSKTRDDYDLCMGCFRKEEEEAAANGCVVPYHMHVTCLSHACHMPVTWPPYNVPNK